MKENLKVLGNIILILNIKSTKVALKVYNEDKTTDQLKGRPRGNLEPTIRICQGVL